MQLSMALTKKKVSNYIPHDISFDILSKLPMKSLKRFTCVCKFWANLFEKPQFMSMFRNSLLLPKYDDYHNSCLLLKQTPAEDHDDDNNIFLLSGETFENSVKLDWPPPFEENREDLSIVGSVVNGILCLCQGNGRGNTTWINVQKIVLWNPYTEEFKVIPSGSFERTILKAFPPGFVNIHGFGYDLVTDDYKLIRVRKNGDIFYLNGIEEVERFNLNTDMIEKVGVKGRHECCQMVIYN